MKRKFILTIGILCAILFISYTFFTNKFNKKDSADNTIEDNYNNDTNDLTDENTSTKNNSLDNTENNSLDTFKSLSDYNTSYTNSNEDINNNNSTAYKNINTFPTSESNILKTSIITNSSSTPQNNHKNPNNIPLPENMERPSPYQGDDFPWKNIYLGYNFLYEGKIFDISKDFTKNITTFKYLFTVNINDEDIDICYNGFVYGTDLHIKNNSPVLLIGNRIGTLFNGSLEVRRSSDILLYPDFSIAIEKVFAKDFKTVKLKCIKNSDDGHLTTGNEYYCIGWCNDPRIGFDNSIINPPDTRRLVILNNTYMVLGFYDFNSFDLSDIKIGTDLLKINSDIMFNWKNYLFKLKPEDYLIS